MKDRGWALLYSGWEIVNSSLEVLKLTANQLNLLNDVLDQLQGSISNFENMGNCELSEVDQKLLEHVQIKLVQLQETMKAASKGLMLLSHAPLENIGKEFQAANYCGQSMLAKSQFRRITELKNKVDVILEFKSNKLIIPVDAEECTAIDESGWFFHR